MRQGPRCDDDPIDFVMLRNADDRPLIVRGAPIAPLGAEFFERAKAFVTFAVIGPAPRPQERLLHEAFGLTAAETRVALAIGDGRDVNDVAALHGVSVSTVRTHLRAVFMKTNTHRQAALSALIARLGALSGPGIS